MEENTSQNPKRNEFVIPDYEGYAMTQIETWEAVRFLLTKLEPIRIEDLDPDDCKCVICQGEFLSSEDEKLTHAPVKTTCGHIFGRSCIIKWLDPLCYWGLTEGGDPKIHRLSMGSIPNAKTNCPTCRRVFFPRAFPEPMQSVASRLCLWDSVYAFAGVARSEKEERTRNDLWEYVRYCSSINEFKLSGPLKRKLLKRAKLKLLDFAIWLKSQALTLSQETLRMTLEISVDSDLPIFTYDPDGPSRHLNYIFSGVNSLEGDDDDEDNGENEDDSEDDGDNEEEDEDQDEDEDEDGEEDGEDEV